MRGLVLCGWILLCACGGGGSDSAAPIPNTPDSSPAPLPSARPVSSVASLDIYQDTIAVAGSSVSIAVVSQSAQTIDTISWRQLSGAAVTLLSPYAQMISFDLPTAGNYRFEFNATLSNGNEVTHEVDIDAEPATLVANVRLDHQASETAKVSLRTDVSDNQEIRDLVWRQLSGPRVSNLQLQGNTAFFDAPSVSADQLLEFEASVTLANGQVLTDIARVLVKDVAINTEGFFPDAYGQIVTEDMRPYIPDSPHAEALMACVYNNQVDTSCSFNRLPLLGQEHATPNIDDVMQRVLVSHPWMGDNFRQFLLSSATREDMLQLLGATTAVVISYDVRPSFYWSATGAIYLDAANFWLTPQQRDTLNDQPDFRRNFGNDLQFRMPWRYVRNQSYYFPVQGFAAEQRRTRDLSQLEANLAWLMYHELAHANDFFPSREWATLDRFSSPLNEVNRRAPESRQLDVQYPLQSQVMHGLARVRFAGDTASDTQKSYVPGDIEQFFVPDDAVMFYSYFTPREDFALLVERFLMHYRLGVSADVGIIGGSGTDDSRLTWGQRDRIGDPQVIDRLVFAVRRVLPTLSEQTIRANLPLAKPLPEGVEWFDAVNLQSGQKALPQSRDGSTYDVQNDLTEYHTQAVMSAALKDPGRF